MRRAALAALLLVLVLAAVAGAYAWGRGTVDAPHRACEPTPPLRVAFGEPRPFENGSAVPLRLQNDGDAPVRVLAGSWEVDSYRVRWDGRLVPDLGQARHVDFVQGYEGEEVAPGGSLPLGDLQLQASEGRYRLVAFANGTCGDGVVTL